MTTTRTASDDRAFGIEEMNAPDQYGSLFWNFTAWRAGHPDRLMAAQEARAELARLKASLPHAADRMRIVDVRAAQARTARFGQLRRAVFAAMGYDALPEGPAKEAAGRAAYLAVRAAHEAAEQAAQEAAQADRDHEAAAAIDDQLLRSFGPAA